MVCVIVGGGKESKRVQMCGHLQFRGQQGAARVHLEAAGRASESRSFARLCTDVTSRFKDSVFGWISYRFSIEEELVLSVERMCLESWRTKGAEIVQLEVAVGAGEALACAIFLASSACKEVGQVHLSQGVLRMAEVDELLS